MSWALVIVIGGVAMLVCAITAGWPACVPAAIVLAVIAISKARP